MGRRPELTSGGSIVPSEAFLISAQRWAGVYHSALIEPAELSFHTATTSDLCHIGGQTHVASLRPMPLSVRPRFKMKCGSFGSKTARSYGPRQAEQVYGTAEERQAPAREEIDPLISVLHRSQF